VENVEGVRASARAGADRAELCDNLAAGGTTPSIGAVEAAIFAAAAEVERRRAIAGVHWASGPAAAPLGLRIMIRPRGGSFVFDADEVRASPWVDIPYEVQQNPPRNPFVYKQYPRMFRIAARQSWERGEKRCAAAYFAEFLRQKILTPIRK